MKKVLCGLLFFLCIGLAACGESKTTENEVPEEVPGEVTDIVFSEMYPSLDSDVFFSDTENEKLIKVVEEAYEDRKLSVSEYQKMVDCLPKKEQAYMKELETTYGTFTPEGEQLKSWIELICEDCIYMEGGRAGATVSYWKQVKSGLDLVTSLYELTVKAGDTIDDLEGVLKVPIKAELRTASSDFHKRTGLTGFIHEGTPVNKPRGDIFKGCTNLETIVLGNWSPEYEEVHKELCQDTLWLKKEAEKGPVVLADCLMSFGNGTETVEVPDGVEHYKDGIWATCKAKEVILTGEVIGGSEFYTTSSVPVEKIIVKEGCKEIGVCAFANLLELREVTLPSTLERIGNENIYATGAFSQCTSLEQIEIPSSVTFIGANTFKRCKSLKTITLPEGLSTIEDYTFYQCDSLQKVELPLSITAIKEGAFSGCVALELSIPACCTEIAEDAFENVKHVSYQVTDRQ